MATQSAILRRGAISCFTLYPPSVRLTPTQRPTTICERFARQEHAYVLRSHRSSCRLTKEAQCRAVLGLFPEGRGGILAFWCSQPGGRAVAGIFTAAHAHTHCAWRRAEPPTMIAEGSTQLAVGVL